MARNKVSKTGREKIFKCETNFLHFHNDVKDGGNQEGVLSVEWGDLVGESGCHD